MRKTVEEESKYILEKENFCQKCGFNSNNKIALLTRCLEADCVALNKKIIQLEPYYNVKDREGKE